MKLLTQVVEQIEEATIQLDKQTVTGSRLALILIDNVIEILMYNLTKDELSLDDQVAIIDGTYLFSWDKIPGNDNSRFIKFLNEKYNINWVKIENIKKTDDYTIIVSTEDKSISLKLNNERTKLTLKTDDCRAKFIARTQDDGLNIFEKFKDKYLEFKNKTQFLVLNGIISQDQKVIMDICHHFRNEAYHANKLRDGILCPIAKVYFRICCEIIPELMTVGSTTMVIGQDSFLAKYGVSIYNMSSFGINIFSIDKFKELMKKFCAGREYNEEELSKLLALDIEKRIISVKKNLKEIQEFDTQKSYTDFEERLKLILSRIEKLKAIMNSSKAIERYFQLDEDLLEIELKVDLIDAILDNARDLAFEEQREREVFGNE